MTYFLFDNPEDAMRFLQSLVDKQLQITEVRGTLDFQNAQTPEQADEILDQWEKDHAKSNL